MIYWQSCILETIVFVSHTYSCLLQEKQIFKCPKRGHPRDVYGFQLREVLRTKLWDILGTSTGRWSKCFLNSTQKHIKLTLTGYSIIVNGSGKKLSEQFMVQKINLNKNKV